MPVAIQIVTTTASRSDAEKIATALVQQRLAACVQISGPILSCYRWQNQFETSEEWRCTIKTTQAAYDHVEQAIRRLHPYEVPEIVAIPIAIGSRNYLDWLAQQVDLGPSKGPAGTTAD